VVDGKVPDYNPVIPTAHTRGFELARTELLAALQRAAILSNEKYRGVKLELSPGKLRIVAHNPEQEEAVEEVEADTHVSDLAVGFNVGYLLDALSALRGDQARLSLRDAQSSCLVQEHDGEQARHVIMPLRL
jgi:DNA polymerase-3 subunit beta